MIHLLWVIPAIMVVVIVTIMASRRNVRIPSISKNWILGVVGVLLALLLILGLRGYGDDKKDVVDESSSTTAPALVLKHECVTPCSALIDYKAQIWGDGPDFWVQFPGIKNPILFSRGKFTAPEGVQAGEVFFTPADPKQPVVIRVYKKVSYRP